MTLTQKSLYSLLIPTALYAASLGQSAIAATSATTKISASIVGGGCQITAPSTVSIRNGDLIPAEEITTSDISETFDLTILGCKGYGLTPSITLEGDTDSASGEALFVSPGSTSTGYGILLSTAGNTNFEGSDNLATDKKITALTTKEWNKTFASTLNGTIPLKATVSCGTCTANNLQGGELTASLTFNFFYHWFWRPLITMIRKLSFFSVIVGLLLPASELQAGSASTTLSFSAFFYGGSCDVTVPNTVTYNNGAPLPYDEILKNPQRSGFTLTLSGCQGYFLTPRIAVKGNTFTADNNESLYADASSTAKGYGVRLSTPGNTLFNANDNTAKPGNEVITIKTWPSDGTSDVARLNSSLDFTAVLACGTCTASDNLQNGELIATVTFSFVYD
nr:hypothetical protein [Providencia sp. wls1916]